MGLNVDVFRVEETLRAINSELFDCIDVFTPTVVPRFRISLSVLVREDGSLCFENCSDTWFSDAIIPKFSFWRRLSLSMAV